MGIQAKIGAGIDLTHIRTVQLSHGLAENNNSCQTHSREAHVSLRGATCVSGDRVGARQMFINRAFG